MLFHTLLLHSNQKIIEIQESYYIEYRFIAEAGTCILQDGWKISEINALFKVFFLTTLPVIVAASADNGC